MELSYLRVEDFRNLHGVELEPGLRFNIVCGPNGQGKTNLLEAIYLLSALKSFRRHNNGDLIRSGQRQAVVEGRIERAGVERVARVGISPQGKRVTLNGAAVQKLSNFFGSLNAIVFAPDDLSIIKGGPSGRRQFVDRAIFNLSAGFLVDAVGYEKILKQRNTALRGDPGKSRLLLDVYDEQLAERGAAVARRRLEFLQEFRPMFLETFAAIFGGADGVAAPKMKLSWQSQWRNPSGDDSEQSMAEQLQMALAAARNEDIRRGHTTRGPHRDDLVISMDGQSMQKFASQGQQRAAVLAMKIAEVRLFQERRGFRPILLLDDVSSELDRSRNRFLFDFLSQHPGQVFISTTHRDHILLQDDVKTFNVLAGEVAPESA